jgi:hypothetical protein
MINFSYVALRLDPAGSAGQLDAGPRRQPIIVDTGARSIVCGG